MHILATTLVALTAFAVTSAQAAPIPSKAYPTGKSHETPAQNVHKSRQYDYLLTRPGDWIRVEYEAVADCPQCSLCTEDGRYQR